MKEKIQTILEKTLPAGCFIHLQEHRILGENSLRIHFAANDYKISGIFGQNPQAVSLSLNEDLELCVQHWGCMGGGRISRKPDYNNPAEKHLASVGIKVPFRTPKKEEKAVLAAVERFAQNWVNLIKEYKEVLTDKQYCDYSNF